MFAEWSAQPGFIKILKCSERTLQVVAKKYIRLKFSSYRPKAGQALTFKLDLSRGADQYDVDKKGKVYVTHPFNDKISITFPVVEEDRQGMIIETMMNITMDGGYPDMVPPPTGLASTSAIARLNSGCFKRPRNGP